MTMTSPRTAPRPAQAKGAAYSSVPKVRRGTTGDRAHRFPPLTASVVDVLFCAHDHRSQRLGARAAANR